MSSRWDALDGQIANIDTLLEQNAPVAAEAEALLRGTPYMAALHEVRLAQTVRRQVRADLRAARDTAREATAAVNRRTDRRAETA